MYKAIICDIKNSRILTNREEVQFLLINALEKCNENFSEFIVSPFRITAGDEWEGLLSINAPIDKILNSFKDNLPNDITFYVGIGEGKLSINNLKLPVNFLDGEVFVHARESLKHAKSNNITIDSNDFSYSSST
ncbi:SatD family protein [Clostridium sp. SHJSY1]|uniref:SatD family protein n=1 Tax=Clostridium sp. SHJSY1 TaxID=2942483 RepID=UPI0028743F30|nr:SatD family protein [Clostridium sp. SHJSY1]MDS0524530.1 SatD family protein [Clostridium sp. SHJSY1]